MNMNGKRKWSAAEKLRIVLEGMNPSVSIADLCRREGISPNHYYLWKKQLLSSASKIFDAKAGRASAAEEKREAELTRLKEVVVEITAENLELKKGLSV
jgi:transposase